MSTHEKVNLVDTYIHFYWQFSNSQSEMKFWYIDQALTSNYPTQKHLSIMNLSLYTTINHSFPEKDLSELRSSSGFFYCPFTRACPTTNYFEIARGVSIIQKSAQNCRHSDYWYIARVCKKLICQISGFCSSYVRKTKDISATKHITPVIRNA